jgi:hypothetical protein
VSNAEDLLSQNDEVKSLWKEAISSVVLKMLDYQKIEQTKKQQEESKITTSIRRTTDHQAKKYGTLDFKGSVGSSSTKKRTMDQQGTDPEYSMDARSTNDSVITSSQHSSNPFQRVKSSSKTLWRTDLSSMSVDERNAFKESQRLQMALERAGGDGSGVGDEETGTACPSCGSARTTTRLLGSYDVSKSETWGFKDACNAVMRIECRECRYIGNVTDGFSFLS